MSGRPIGIDLFAGVGGLSLGFEQAGFDIGAAVEIDPVHAAAHKFNFPESTVIPQSVKDLTGDMIRQMAGIGEKPVDCVFGGAPCQGFSLIGHRILDDPRNSLVLDFVRIVAELKARTFVFENVKGLTVGNHRKFLAELVSAFDMKGYQVRLPWRVLNAGHFGTPQNRERLILLGARKGERLPSYPVRRFNVPGRSRRVDGLPDGPTCRDALDDLPDAERYPQLSDGDTVRARFGAPSAYARELRALTNDAWHYGHVRDWNPAVLTSSRRTSHTAISRRRFAETPPGTVEPISRFFKLPPDGASNTLRAGTDGARGAFTSPRPIHYRLNRCVTVREMARLHGFPDWFRFNGTKWHGARQIGNAVPPPLARAVAGEVVKALGLTPHRPDRSVRLGNAECLSFNLSAAARYFGVPRPLNRRDRKSGARKRRQSDIERERTREDLMAENTYAKIVERVFFEHYRDDDTVIEFGREELATVAAALGVTVPKNLGDVIYAFRHRLELPEKIVATQTGGMEWVIVGAGTARYRFQLAPISRIVPRENLVSIDIPDATPEVIRLYRLNDEQALLAIVRYNRLIDIFLGLTAYSLQNHLRTHIKDIGQIEIDELYVGIDKQGRHYAIPVQAKGGTDKIGSVQVGQDISFAEKRFPGMPCRAVAAQFMPDETVALFELAMEDGAVKVADERHYRLVPASDIEGDVP